MTETAIVQEIRGNKVSLIVIKGEDCKSCSGHGCKVEGKEFTALNSIGIDLSVGDTVKVYLPPGKAILASFMILIFPLVLFILFYTLFGRIFGIESEGVKALFGVAGLASGFGLSFLLRTKRGDEDLPEIMRKDPTT